MHRREEDSQFHEKLIIGDAEIKAALTSSHCLEKQEYSLEPDFKMGYDHILLI